MALLTICLVIVAVWLQTDSLVILSAPVVLVVPGLVLMRALGVTFSIDSLTDMSIAATAGVAVLSLGGAGMLLVDLYYPRLLVIAFLVAAAAQLLSAGLGGRRYWPSLEGRNHHIGPRRSVRAVARRQLSMVTAAVGQTARRPKRRYVYLHAHTGSNSHGRCVPTDARAGSFPSRAEAEGRVVVWVCLTAVGAIGLSTWAAARTEVFDAHTYGLSAIVHPGYFAALGLLVVLVLWAILSERGTTLASLAGMGGLIVIFYGFVPVLTQTPLYAWSYKHVGVARSFGFRGDLDLAADIYNRWPSALAGFSTYADALGVDVMSLARWSEPAFMALHTSLVYALARVVLSARAPAVLAALLFMTTNWVGQSYFAPQPVAYMLALCLMLLILRSRLRPATTRLMTLLARGAALDSPDQRQGGWVEGGTWRQDRWLALLLLLACVSGHQLTPYFLVLQLATIGAFGFLFSWLRLTAAVATTAILYLLPNLPFVLDRYGLLTGLSPLDNARVAAAEGSLRAPLAAQAGGTLSLTVAALAFIGLLVLLRNGQRQVGILLSCLSAAPFLILLGANYGGEGSLRVYLFSSPWRDLLIAAALFQLPRLPRILATVTVSGLLTAMFVFVQYVHLATIVFPRSVVAVAEEFYRRAPEGSALFLAGRNFPTWLGERYYSFSGPLGDGTPNIVDLLESDRHAPQAEDLDEIIEEMQNTAERSFLVFSTTQERYASLYGPLPRDWPQQLERAVKSSDKFVLYSGDDSARIYGLLTEGDSR